MNNLSLSTSLAPFLSEEVSSRCVLSDGHSLTQHEFTVDGGTSGLTPPASSLVTDAQSKPVHADLNLGVFRATEWPYDELDAQTTSIVESVSIDANVEPAVSQPLDGAFVLEVTLTSISTSTAVFSDWLTTVLSRLDELAVPHSCRTDPFEYSNALTCEACGNAEATSILRVRNGTGEGVHVGACSTCSEHLSGYTDIDDSNTRDTPRFN
jgi:hypothetical protein